MYYINYNINLSILIKKDFGFSDFWDLPFENNFDSGKIP